MKKENNSLNFIQKLAKVFKPAKPTQKKAKPKTKPKPRTPNWMYRNE